MKPREGQDAWREEERVHRRSERVCAPAGGAGHQRRNALRIVQMSASTYPYRSAARDPTALKMRIKDTADTRVHSRDRRVHVLLRQRTARDDQDRRRQPFHRQSHGRMGLRARRRTRLPSAPQADRQRPGGRLQRPAASGMPASFQQSGADTAARRGSPSDVHPARPGYGRQHVRGHDRRFARISQVCGARKTARKLR